MKIGILTFQRAHNYGAVLQAYALKEYLISQNHSCEFIDYWPTYHRREFPVFPFSTKGINVKWRIKLIGLSLINLRVYLSRYRKFNAFIHRFLGLPANGEGDINQLKTEMYDAIVYGSDQIWRKHNLVDYHGFDSVYFGEMFTSCRKKIVYAGSMGRLDLNHEESKWFRKSIENFSYVSVRESDLQKKIEELTGFNPPLVLDPVFLLSKDEWVSKLNIQKSKRPYILLYQLHPSPNAVKIAQRLKETHNIDIVEIYGSIDPYKKNNSDCHQTAGPIDFVSLVSNATFVVSTSYHGIVFSLIFNKNFYATGMGNNTARVKTLLENLKIPSRYIDQEEQIDPNLPIEYSGVNEILGKFQAYSKAYLQNSLNEIATR